MADRIQPFAVTVPPATLKAFPLVTNLFFQDGVVTRIITTVPPGPSGLVGFNYLHLGGPVIPVFGGGFFVADGRVIDWTVTGMPTSSGWQIQAYNTDIYPHTIYIEFLVDEIVSPLPPPVTLVNIGS